MRCTFEISLFKNGILCLLILALFTSCVQNVDRQNAITPNIVFILADDLGYNELSSYGQKMFQTRNIDQLAKEGMRFTDFYAGTAVCAPSRGSLITGKHMGNASVRGNNGRYPDGRWDRVGIKKTDTTLGEIVKKAGYTTALCGKWHLEYYDDSLTTWPKHRGFDYVIRERWNKRMYKEWESWTQITGRLRDENYPHELYLNGKRIEIPGNIDGERRHHLDEINTERGIDFIRRNKDNPFMIYFSMKIPHAPEEFESNKELFADKDWPEHEKIHARRILYLDHNVGRIVQTIDSLGLSENTIIMFTSDHGGHAEGHWIAEGKYVDRHDHTFFNSNAPFRGMKRDLYEGGIRVPFIVKWPGRIQPNSQTGHLAAFWDVLPTFADLAGVTTTYEHDGISFLPELLGQNQQTHDYLYWEIQLNGRDKNQPDGGFRQAVRFENWKSVRYGYDAEIELYDLNTDLSESEDLNQEHPEIVKRMDSLMRVTRRESIHYPFGGTKLEHKL